MRQEQVKYTLKDSAGNSHTISKDVKIIESVDLSNDAHIPFLGSVNEGVKVKAKAELRNELTNAIRAYEREQVKLLAAAIAKHGSLDEVCELLEIDNTVHSVEAIVERERKARDEA